MTSPSTVGLEAEISDIRNTHHFRCITFSEFKKTDVKRELFDNIFKSKIEPACYWSAELICSGHYSDLWDIILSFYGKHIHYGNPKMAIYLQMRISKFKEIVHQYFRNDELRMRNHEGIRKLFAEIITLLCCAKRKTSFDEIRIKQDDFDLVQMQERLKAPNFRFVENCGVQPEDPNEVLVAMNELCFHVQTKNSAMGFYWVEWMVQYDALCRARKQPLQVARRSFAPVDPKYQKDMVWLLWDALIHKAQTYVAPADQQDKKAMSTGLFIQKTMLSLMHLFSLKYMPTNARKRNVYLFFGVSLLTEKIAVEEEIMNPDDKEIVKTVLLKIDRIYRQIKKNEHSPKMDYLYGSGDGENGRKSNFDKTISQLETLDAFGDKFIPRV